MIKILVGTTNKAKVNRFKEMLKDYDIEFLDLKSLNITTEPLETGSTPLENAVIKAEYYGKFFDIVLCNDSGLYFKELAISDSRQLGLHIRTPEGKRLDDNEVITYYSNLIHSLGGKVTAYYLDGIAVYNHGKVYSFIENIDKTINSAFYMVDKPSSVLKPGWPLDSLSLNICDNSYFSEVGDNKYDNKIDEENYSEYHNRLINFILDSIK